MKITSIILGFIASLLVLCQWFTFQSIRRYLFPKSGVIRRRIAYPALMLFGLVTILAVRLEYGYEIFEPGTYGRQLASVVIFSYFGWILTVSSLFLVIRIVEFLIKHKSEVPESSVSKGLWSGSQRGGISIFSIAKESGRSSAGSAPNAQTTTRRAFFKTAAVSGLVAATGLGSYGLSEGYSEPRIRKYDLFLDPIDGAANPVTLIHITDLHFGMFWGQRELLGLVDNLNSIEGDALCITGDVFHSGRTRVEQATPILKKLKTRSLGNFAILGNHEFYAGVARCVQSMETAEIRVLRNQWITLKLGSATIHMGGVDDPAGNHWSKANNSHGMIMPVMEAPAETGTRILLSHRPDVFPSAARQNVDLVLAGHLHGGQIAMPVPGYEPGISAASLASDYVYGWYENHRSRMYVSSGIGMTFLPWRIGCAPEISVIRIGSPSRLSNFRDTENG
jgi:uncharacterized protein